MFAIGQVVAGRKGAVRNNVFKIIVISAVKKNQLCCAQLTCIHISRLQNMLNLYKRKDTGNKFKLCMRKYRL